MTTKIARLVSKNTALFLCDMQEKFRPTIQYFPQIIEVSSRMLGSARALDMPVIVTEQYPKGLGPTVPELKLEKEKVFAKTSFSMMIQDVQSELKKLTDVDSIIICGIEAHACVQCTALDLLEDKYNVHVIVDACSSRSMVDRMYAFERMKNAGAHLTTSESALLALLGGASHPRFKEVQKFIWTSAPDSGLLSGVPHDGTPV